ncbi:ABC transporter ATP-binding protein [Actinophytocola sp.]|uniref:ABC transporter ATP-binding protein n=1 Tax=Actinophytocola sp. TaxID=1872138 RepID=UPI0038999F7D
MLTAPQVLAGSRPLRRYLGPRTAQLALLAVALLAATGLAIVGPQLLRRFIDAVGGDTAISAVVALAVAFLVVTVLAELSWLTADAVGVRLAWSATNDMRTDLTAHCLSLDMPFYEERAAGELIDRVDGDVGRLAGFFSQLFLLIASNLLLLLGIGVALLIQDWRVGLCYIPFVGGSALLLRRLLGRAVPAVVAQRQANAELLGYVEERLGGLEDIRGNGAGHHVRHGFWLRAAGLLTAARRAARLGVRWPAAAQGLASLSLLLALLAGAILYSTGQMTLGSAYVLVAYAGMLQVPLMVLVSQAQEVEEAVGALRRIDELFAVRSTIVDGAHTLGPHTPGGGVEVVLDDVSFGYRPGELAVREVNVRVAPGRRLALVGRTGSGKSTLARLLVRFADPVSGRVLLDGRDIRDLTVSSVRSRVGLVTQDVRIFHASVRDNVTMFGDEVPDSAVEEALRAVGLEPWLSGLPAGLASVLGAGEAGLSAGEAQLLAFARILVTDPGLVVLDEASSRLDQVSRKTFDTALTRMLAGRTAVVIAHQLAAVRVCDEVLVLRDGRVLEHGDRATLVADRNSVFADMLRTGEAFE